MNLKLVYNKIESNNQGIGSSLQINFSENINAVPYFEESVEETLIMDANNKKKNRFSIKKYNQKYSEIYKNNISENGYQVFVPRKALADNRVFEVFNWRLIAKSKQSISTDLLGDPSLFENSNNISARVVNVGVLYDSFDTTSNAIINPYVFYRLENSPFNFSKFVFSNPLADTSIDKTNASYWKVDIQSVLQSVSTLRDFDFLVFSPTKSISQDAYRLIDDFVKNHNGTILVDGSNYPSGETFFSSDISISKLQTTNATYIEYNTSSKILDENKNGGWNIDSTIFEKDTYGIFGKLQKNDQKYKYINNAIDSNTIVKIGNDEATAKAVACLYQFPSKSDALIQGNVIFSSLGFLQYCNAVYNSAGDGTILDSSTGEVAYNSGTTQIFSGVVEGPYKFLYNSIAFALYCRTYASRRSDQRSILYNYVGDWNSSWVMFSDALMDDEKAKYFTNISSNVNEVKWGRDLISGYDSVEKYYKKLLTESLPDYLKDKVSRIDLSNVEYYVEITNPDVEISNCADFSTLELKEEENIPSAYYLKKVYSSDLKVFAYTDKYSPSLSVPNDFGPHVVKEVSGIKSSDTKKLVNYINPSTQFKSYDFDLQTDYSFIYSKDKPVSFNITYNTDLILNYKGQVTEYYTAERIGYIIRKFKTKAPDGWRDTSYWQDPNLLPGSAIDNINVINIKSSADRNLYAAADSDKSYNNFKYTGDINEGNSTNSWTTAYAGRSYEYVKFIQIAMKATGRYGGGNFSDWPVDGKYGDKTATAIQNFQQTRRNLGDTVLYVDGIVDSETKALISKRLLELASQDPERYNRWKDQARIYGVLRFWNASVDAGNIESLGSGAVYKKISFTGFEGPSTITDVIYFEIPASCHYVTRLKIDFGYWKNVKVVTYGWSNIDSSEAAPLTSQQRLNRYNQRLVNLTPDSAGVVTINTSMLNSDCKYMYIKVRSNSKLNTLNAIFGPYAEGYSLQSIKVDGVTAPVWSERVYVPRGEKIPGEVTDYTQIYEGVDSLTEPPESSNPEFEGRQIRNYYSGRLYYDNGLKAYDFGHKVYVRSNGKYYEWNGSGWTEIILPSNATELSEERQIEDYIYNQTKDVDLLVEAISTEYIESLTPTNLFRTSYDTQTIKSKNLVLKKISYTYKDKKYSHDLEPETGLGSGDYTTPQTGVKLKLGEPLGVRIKDKSSVTISSLKSDTGVEISNPLTAISINYYEQQFTIATVDPIYREVEFSTSATYYSGSTIKVLEPKIDILSLDYTCLTLDGRVIGKTQSVTVNDGIVLLAKNNTNSPIGIPSYSEIAKLFYPLAADEEQDISLGYVSVYSLMKNNDGFIYGFYDVLQKEFIGTVIPYIDIVNRGIENVYIAVCAIDADGNTQNKVDYIGPKVSMTFKPIDIPIKKIYPIYSVKINSNSRIKIGNTAFNLDKKEAWPLAISQGSFIKKINLDSNVYANWQSKYLNQELLCTYDTNNIPEVNYSKIFGRGYYEIKDENPILVSETKIQVRQSPFTVWAEPSNYNSSKIKLIRPQFQIFINTNPNAKATDQRVWEEVPFSKIKNYNANLGLIEFKERLVPQNEIDIKISYVAKNNDLQIYQVDGSPIPLNPLLNKEEIQINKTLYIYVLPTKIEKKNDLVSQFSTYTKVNEYSNSTPVNFTYDKDIFNPSSISYNPFALLIGTIIYTKANNATNIYDTRLKGGGVASRFNVKDLVKNNPEYISYWDMYSPDGMAYPKGGYVIIKIPNEVKNNFQDVQQIYDIVYRNLTAGVSFEIQDMDGNPYGVK